MPTDLFDLDEGPTFTNDYSGTIADVVFMNEDYGVRAHVTVELDDPIPKKDGGLMTDRTLYLSAGKTLTASDDGTTLVRPGDAKVSASSWWGRFVKGATADETARKALVESGASPYETQGWIGHRFHFMTAPTETKKIDGEDREVKGKDLPVEYLGTKSSPQAGTVGAQLAPEFNLTLVPDDLIEKWAPMAESNDAGKFASLVVASGDLTQDALGASLGPVTKAVGDGSLHKALLPF